jgi:hypothetical protein
MRLAEEVVMSEGINVLAMLLIAAFAIERITSGILFLLEFFHVLPDPESFEKPQRERLKRKRALWSFLISAGLTVLLLLYIPSEFGFVNALGVGTGIPPLLDRILLGVVLLGGSERMSVFLKMVGAPGGDAGSGGAQAVEVSGKLTLEDPGDKARVAGR